MGLRDFTRSTESIFVYAIFNKVRMHETSASSELVTHETELPPTECR